MAACRRLNLKGVWIPIAFFLITLTCADPRTPYAAWLRSAIGANSTQPAKSHLIKFVGMGVGAAIGLAVILAVSIFTWKRWPRWTAIGLCPALMALFPSIVYAGAMLRRCLLLINAHEADIILQDDGLAIRSHESGAWAGVAIFAVLAVIAYLYDRHRDRRRNRDATADVALE